MATTLARLLTADEFRQLPPAPNRAHMELVRGEIVMTPPPGFDHGVVQLQVGTLLNQWARSTKAGRVTTESGVVTERLPDTVRGPDIAFWSYERVPAGHRPKGYPDAAPELCVEVLSADKRPSALREKLGEYFARGVIVVWVIDSGERTVTIYRSPDEGRILHDTATLSGDDVLPGFSCKVADIFA